ncbi:MAG: energy-coupling factor transporter transmembrane component T [Desulfobacteraceae bacterium]
MGVTPFAYTPSTSPLQKVDARCKLFCLSVLSIATLGAGFLPLTVLISLLFCLLNLEQKSPGRVILELKYFCVLLVFVFIARAVTTPGDPVAVFLNTDVTRQGLLDGTLICLRFFAVMLLGMIFTCTTRPSLVKGAVEWFLRPVPLIPEKRAAVMITLFLRFLPLVLQQAHEIRQAQQARCADLKKNPVTRAVNLAVPLLKKTFIAADRLATAMASRSYSERRTDPEVSRSGLEKKVYSAALFLAALLVVL